MSANDFLFPDRPSETDELAVVVVAVAVAVLLAVQYIFVVVVAIVGVDVDFLSFPLSCKANILHLLERCRLSFSTITTTSNLRMTLPRQAPVRGLRRFLPWET